MADAGNGLGRLTEREDLLPCVSSVMSAFDTKLTYRVALHMFWRRCCAMSLSSSGVLHTGRGEMIDEVTKARLAIGLRSNRFFDAGDNVKCPLSG